MAFQIEQAQQQQTKWILCYCYCRLPFHFRRVALFTLCALSFSVSIESLYYDMCYKFIIFRRLSVDLMESRFFCEFEICSVVQNQSTGKKISLFRKYGVTLL